MKNCQVLVLKNNQILLSQLEPTEAELPGEPDVRLIDPYLVEGNELTRWLKSVTIQNEMMIQSDQIITIVEPTPALISSYNEVLQER